MNGNCNALGICLSVVLAASAGCSSVPKWFGARQAELAAVDGEQAADAACPALTMARLAERRNQTDQAKRLYLMAIEELPDEALPHHRLGVIFAREGTFEQAHQHFLRAMELAPESAEVLGDAGHFYYLCNDSDRAIELLNRALELDPNSARISNNLAVLLGEQGEDQSSLALFRRAGSEAQSHANMGFVYAQRGDLDKAIDSYSHALTLDGNLRPAGEALVQLAAYLPPDHPAAGQRLAWVPPDSAASGTAATPPRTYDAAQVGYLSPDTPKGSAPNSTQPGQAHHAPPLQPPSWSQIPQGWQPPPFPTHVTPNGQFGAGSAAPWSAPMAAPGAQHGPARVPLPLGAGQ